MKRFGVLFGLLCLLGSLFSGCRPSFQPGAYTDDLNRSVSFNETPKRIVAYGPSITEILYSLGLEANVVGVDSSATILKPRNQNKKSATRSIPR